MSSNNPRYAASQRNRSLNHPTIAKHHSFDEKNDKPNDEITQEKDNDRNVNIIISGNTDEFTFVVCADTIGMTSLNKEWQTELEYSRQAIQAINALEPRPLFCCVCGDLVDMVASYYAAEHGEDECNRIQDLQNDDWKATWESLHPDIALVCVCGNHDVGNRPTKTTIERFVNAFGDDYLAFWVKRTYNIVLNTSLFWDPTGAESLYREQLAWLEDRLASVSKQQPSHIFVFGHHPWFLYDEHETAKDLTGISPRPSEWEGEGHFHQNLVSRSSFDMDMIVTSSLSLTFHSSGIPSDFDEPKDSRGMRIVRVRGDGTFDHNFVSLP
ncbi:hypothetical protein MPSEU_000948000 [Mayamaea pseudoterrestris]|nr:hypothetical protein MPSEU_000948000 [Mayamaea pseudoterrestris]